MQILTRQVASTAVAIFVSAMTVSGCSAGAGESRSSSSSTRAPNSYEEMNAEFNASKKNLRLPAEVAWPAEVRRDGSGDLYAPGYGTSQAEQFWYCSWAKKWLFVRAVSEDDASAALSELKSVKRTSLYLTAFAPEVQRETDNELAAAEKGDPKLLSASVERNC
ncbi:hypothetical protein ACFYPG_28475 [Micromonospora sp. NPDC005553]|uniref:hypothetical protein n=1 Tax=Micromonospora sp. NPDC005553 TaxID=3364232 RepID=UPI003686C098